VRTFEHEAQTRLVISVDTRPTMWLPVAAPKVRLACWMSEALAYISGRSGDSVALHDLFASSTRSVIELGRVARRENIRHALNRLGSGAKSPATLTLAPLQRALPPASVWLIFTDLYFDRDEDADRLVSYVLDAQRGARWVVLVELDTWPHERELLGRGPRRIEGPGVSRDPRLEVTDETLRIVEERLERQRQRFQRARAGGFTQVRWSWPPRASSSLQLVFRRWLFFDPVLRRLLRKDGGV
jgi:uncharacterized protein (DUF58 family)